MYLEVKDIKKSYGKDGSYVQVLKGIKTGLERGKMCVIQGTSGSGKSTFLNCIGGLDTLDSGSIKVDGKEIAGLKPAALSDYRREYLGFIFQFYNLVPNLTVRENIQVCQYLSKQPLDMEELLDTLGLTEHQNKFPSQLSGGQQQNWRIYNAENIKKKSIAGFKGKLFQISGTGTADCTGNVHSAQPDWCGRYYYPWNKADGRAE